VPSLLAAVAAYGLEGTGTRLPDRPLDAATWQAVLAGAAAERLAGLLARAVADGALATHDHQAGEAAGLEREWAQWALVLERRLLEVSADLAAAGIDHLVLKGPAFAHGAYTDPALRCFADIDLLVPGAALDAAIARLVAGGARRRFDEPRPGFVSRFGKGASVVSPDGLEIDLHRTFVAGPLGLRIDLEALFASAVPFSLGGRTLRRLAPEEAFVHACYHAVLGSATPRLVPQRDVAELAGSGLDIERVHVLAVAWRARAVVAGAVAGAWSRFELDGRHPLAAWSGRYRASWAERRALAVSAGPGRSYPAEAVAAVLALPGARDRLAYLRAVLFPDRAYLGRREGSYRARLGHAVQVARHLRDRPS
jgi:hypothetical protein